MGPPIEGFATHFQDLTGRRETVKDHRFTYEDQRRALILAKQSTLDWWTQQSGLPVFPMSRETLFLPAGRILRGLSFDRCVLRSTGTVRFERCSLQGTGVWMDGIVLDRSRAQNISISEISSASIFRTDGENVRFSRIDCSFQLSQSEMESLMIEHLYARDENTWIEQSFLRKAAIYFVASHPIRMATNVLEKCRFTVVGAMDLRNNTERSTTWVTRKKSC